VELDVFRKAMLYSYKTSYGFHLLIAIDDAESKIKGIG
jgi:hypothetical protein